MELAQPSACTLRHGCFKIFDHSDHVYNVEAVGGALTRLLVCQAQAL
jgi:hypothetical protein